MSRVERHSIVDYMTYNESREQTRKEVMEAKRSRRIHVGEYLTFLFENCATIRYQVQEMMRTERIVREKDIQHELDTYNEVLGGEGELGCTLLIEIDDPDARDEKLTRWLGLPEKLYLRLEDKAQAYATFDVRQVGDTRLSSVQYIKFDTGGRRPVGIGCEHNDPELNLEVELSPAQYDALVADLTE